jgi:hypothetical protein
MFRWFLREKELFFKFAGYFRPSSDGSGVDLMKQTYETT